MKLDYLRYFDHLANVLSYTQAAADLYIAQPTLSVAIKRMEEELGCKLFNRAKGEPTIALTPEGHVFHEYVALALNNYDTGLRILKEMQGEENSVLHIGTLYAMQGQFWSQAIHAFLSSRTTEPQITVDQAYSAELVRRLRHGSLDAVFAARTPGDEDLDHILVWSQPLAFAVHKTSPYAKRKSVTLHELKELPILTYTETSPGFSSLKQGLPLEEMNLNYSYDDELTLSAMICSDSSNMALFMYSFLVAAFDDVVCIPISDITPEFHKIYLTSRHERHPKIVQEFLTYMGRYHFPNIAEVATKK